MRLQIRDHLAIAERQISEGIANVERQRQLIKEMKSDGHEVGESLWFLELFEEALATRREHRDRLLAQLAGADRSDQRAGWALERVGLCSLIGVTRLSE
jgi:hypothetical protein